MPRWQNVGLLFLILLLVVLPLEQAHGDEFKLTPSLRLRQAYNDNIFFDESGKQDDFITSITPALELVERTERFDARLLGEIKRIEYWDNGDLSDWDQYYLGRFRYQLAPRMGIGGQASYLRDSQPDRDIETTGLVFGTQTRKRQNYKLSSEFVLSENTAAELSYAYERENFSNPYDDDNRTHSANLGFIRDLRYFFSSTTGRTNFRYDRYEFPDARVDVDNYTWTIGATREFSELVSVGIDGGPRYTRTDVDEDRTGADDSSEWGGVGQLVFSYKGELTKSNFTAYRDLRVASGEQGTTERTALIFDIDQRFTYEFRGKLAAEYFLNKAERGKTAGEDIDEKTFRIRPSLRYEFTRDLAVEAGYAYTRTVDDEYDTRTNRNLVFIQLRVQYPLFE